MDWLGDVVGAVVLGDVGPPAAAATVDGEGRAFSLFVSWEEDAASSDESGASAGSEEGSGARKRGDGGRATGCGGGMLGMGNSVCAV